MAMNLRATLLLVHDLERATRFYEGLGLKTVMRFDRRLPQWPYPEMTEVDAGTSKLWLHVGWLDHWTRWKPDYPVVIFRVDDIEKAREQVERHGGTVVSELGTDPLGAYYIFQDTEGNVLEIRQSRA